MYNTTFVKAHRLPGHPSAQCSIAQYQVNNPAMPSTMHEPATTVFVLRSYNTDVCMVRLVPVTTGNLSVPYSHMPVALFTGTFSVTTAKHISWFMNWLSDLTGVDHLGLSSASIRQLVRAKKAINLATGEVYDVPKEDRESDDYALNFGLSYSVHRDVRFGSVNFGFTSGDIRDFALMPLD